MGGFKHRSFSKVICQRVIRNLMIFLTCICRDCDRYLWRYDVKTCTSTRCAIC